MRLALPGGNGWYEFKDADGVLVCDIVEQGTSPTIGWTASIHTTMRSSRTCLDKKALMAEAKRLSVPDFNGRMSAETIAAKIEGVQGRAAGRDRG